MLRRLQIVSITCAIFTATQSYAEVCDYRPSRVLGKAESTAVITGTTVVTTTSGAASALGVYTLVHASSGLTMLGSTMAGASGAGTIGIIGGTGGAIGGTVAIIMNPFVWVPAAIIGVGGGGFEAACAFLVDERITKFEDVLKVMRSFAAHADTNYFELVEKSIPPIIRLADGKGNWQTYKVEDLYIVDGILKHRDWGPNTDIGRVVLLSDPKAEVVKDKQEQEK